MRLLMGLFKIFIALGLGVFFLVWHFKSKKTSALARGSTKNPVLEICPECGHVKRALHFCAR